MAEGKAERDPLDSTSESEVETSEEARLARRIRRENNKRKAVRMDDATLAS